MQAFLDSRHALGECVLWCERSGRLLWTDIPAATLWSYEPARERTRSWAMPERLGSFALTGSDDRLLLGLASGLALFRFSTGKVTHICAVEPGLPTRINDGRCDRQGRFVFGMLTDSEDPQAPSGGFYRLHLDLTLERLALPPARIANSICFSPDGRRMMFADSTDGAIRYCDYNPCSAEIGAVHTLVAAGAAAGAPDGATVDAAGCLWSARWGAGQVLRFAPDGRLLQALATGTPQPTCPAFGGPGLATLYLSTAHAGLDAAQLAAAPLSGALLRQAFDAHEVRGLPEARFLHG